MNVPTLSQEAMVNGLIYKIKNDRVFNETDEKDILNSLSVCKDVDLNYQDENGETLLFVSCYRSALSLIKGLIPMGVDVDKPSKNGQTPLMIACAGGNTEIVSVFIDKGANMSAVDEGGSHCGHYACFNKRIALGKLLIDNGIDMELKDSNGNSPLELAKQYNCEEFITYYNETKLAKQLIKSQENNPDFVFSV